MHFHIVDEKAVKSGETTDIYFKRTLDILEKKGIEKQVVADVTATSLPEDWKWGILTGIEEVAHLFDGIPVDVYALEEGSLFYPIEPVVSIEGNYKDFCLFETPLLGLICQASGIATSSARCKIAAEFRPVYSFGIRRLHPIISPMVDRAAFIGGCDGVSGISGAKLIGEPPAGTMPHALIIIFGDHVKAWQAFEEVMPKEVPRVVLVDTYYDEKIETILAAENLKRLDAVRLDTPSSRRGDMGKIAREVRWELDLRGFKDVKIFVSGGLNEEKIAELNEFVDAYGIGGHISDAPIIDFAMDIVEVEGVAKAKRGKFGGKKQIYECEKCVVHKIVPFGEEAEKCPRCNGKMKPILKPLVKNGKIVAELPEPKEIRKRVLDKLKRLGL